MRGLGSGEEGWREPFLDRLVGVLGHPEERASYRTFSGKYPRAILEAALRRVMAMPRDRIRKNPGALFTYLVKTMTR